MSCLQGSGTIKIRLPAGLPALMLRQAGRGIEKWNYFTNASPLVPSILR